MLCNSFTLPATLTGCMPGSMEASQAGGAKRRRPRRLPAHKGPVPVNARGPAWKRQWGPAPTAGALAVTRAARLAKRAAASRLAALRAAMAWPLN